MGGRSGDVSSYPAGSLTKTTILDENGSTSTRFVDHDGHVVSSMVDPSGLNLQTTFSYDAAGNLLQSTDPSGLSSSYAYDTRGRITSKQTSDAGVARFFYDGNNNLRLVKDDNHTGTRDTVYRNAQISCPNATSGSFTLTMPGMVHLTTGVYDIDQDEYETIRIKANGATILSTSTVSFNGSSASMVLPKGTYTYEVTKYGSYGYFTWQMSCQTNYGFVYNKYDSLGRMIETGQYESSDTTGFTQGNADMPTFPSTGNIIAGTYVYDTPCSDTMVAGQRNLKGRLSAATSFGANGITLSTYFSYDSLGRVEWVIHKGFGTASRKFVYAYNMQGELLKKTYYDTYVPANNYAWWYQYDQLGRLLRVFSGSDSTSRVREAEYSYVGSGGVSQLMLGATPAQTLTYSYSPRDWLRSVTSTQFWEKIGYDTVAEVGSTVSASPQYSGNISWMAYSENGNNFTWGPPYSTTTIGYGFGYDQANRLTSAKFGFKYGGWSAWNSYNMPTIGYDRSGNIDTLVRYGTNATLMDNLKYHYLANSNRLDYIHDGVSSGTFSTDIDNQLSRAYTYDGNGNVQTDTSRSIAFIIYNIDNLPTTVYKRDGTVIQYAYGIGGQRAVKTVGSTFTWYVPGAEAKADIVYNNATSNPTYNLWAADNVGQVKRNGTSLTRYYYQKDHLGDIRMTVNATGGVDSYADFYPYGLLMDGRVSTGSADGRYKFTGKERDGETGYDYFGARYYDSRIARWLGVDPLAEKYAGWSPYTYAADNCIRIVDPNGADLWDKAWGFLNAGIADAFPPMRQDPQTYSGNKTDFASGQLMGDLLTLSSAVFGEMSGAGLTITGLAAAPGTAGGSLILSGAGAGMSLGGGYLIATSTAGVVQDMSYLQAQAAQVSPNYGSKGKPDHQESVEKAYEEHLTQAKEGETVLREKKVQGHDSRRRPDVQTVDKSGRTRRVTEVERRPGSKRHLDRKKEYEELGIENDTRKPGE